MRVIILRHHDPHYVKGLDDMMMARVFRWYDYHVKACKVIFAISVGQENMLISNMQALLRLLSYLTIVFEDPSEHENGPDKKSLLPFFRCLKSNFSFEASRFWLRRGLGVATGNSCRARRASQESEMVMVVVVVVVVVAVGTSWPGPHGARAADHSPNRRLLSFILHIIKWGEGGGM